LGFNEGQGTWCLVRFTEQSSESIQAQFRLTAQRLGQLRDRKDAQGRLISRDISILLQQGNETLARAKAQRLIQDEIMGNLLENLEMQIGILLERFSELERCVYNCHNVRCAQGTRRPHSGGLSPLVVEAASTVIFAAPQIDSRGGTRHRP
jgi:hypothetical protein